MPLVAFDLAHPELVAHELEEANRRLAKEREVPESIRALIKELSEQLADTDGDELQAVDPYLWIEVQQAAIRALRAVDEDDPDQRRSRVRVSLEQLRFLLTRIAERQAVSETQPIGDLLRWLDNLLDVAQPRKADLFGVSERTYQRWISETEQTEPDDDEERTIRVVARITNQLRHSLGGPGVVDWLAHPRDELGGVPPIDALRNPDAMEPVLALAISSRASAAA